MLNLEIHNSWGLHLKDEFKKDYYKDLMCFVEDEYKSNTCYPKLHEIFNAFNYCHFNDLKVVIIGQDPYHGEGQANGLCFSVKEGVKHPPSLKNIFKEIKNNSNTNYCENGDLSRWAKQGVLLLNATLTVRKGEAGSHQKKGWEKFTNAVINIISEKKENVVFLLWGGFAKNKINIIDENKHHILTSGHPSPLSANKGYWFGNHHFEKTNLLLNKYFHNSVRW